MLEDSDLIAVQAVRNLVAKAHEAQRVFAEFSQQRIDDVVQCIASAGLRHSERLASLAVEETGIGLAADKHIKNTFVCRNLAQYIAPLRTVGVISEDAERQITEIGVPMGVVAAIIPTTNPTSTAIFKCLISLKAGNGVVLSPHPRATRCIAEAARVCGDAAVAAGAPEGIIGCISMPTQEAAHELMHHKDVAIILATGGPGLVRAAYSSGKPAFGVGPGNVPAYIDRTAEVTKAVRDVLTGKTFDNGTLCSSEQSVVVDKPVAGQVEEELSRLGALILDGDQAAALQNLAVLADGSLNPAIVGKSAGWIAEKAGIVVPDGTRVLVVRLSTVGREAPLSCEKLSPILALYVVDGWREGCERCKEILAYGGMGHTLAIHCQDQAVVTQFGLEKPASRICVNTPATHGSIGYTTALAPSLTLGCGTFGNNITTDNITPLHLIQLKRLAWERTPVYPSWFAASDLPERTFPSETVSQPQAPTAEVGRSVCGSSSTRSISGWKVSPPSSFTPVEFVCESDVRTAIARGSRIPVGPRTIITPAARDLAGEHDVFLLG